MMKKGLGRTVTNMLLFLFFAGFSIAIIFMGFSVHINIESVVYENEILNREVIFGKVLLSSDELVYSDENGIHKGVISEEDLNQLDDDELLSNFSYKPDSISKDGYLHYVSIDVFDEQSGRMRTVKEFISSSLIQTPGQYHFSRDDVISLPINYIDTQGNVHLGKMYVNIIPT